MKYALFSMTALLLTFSATTNAFADPSISIGCFRFGTETCDPTANPPSINLGGFQMGEVNPDEASANAPTFYKVVSANCGNGIGPSLSVGQTVEFAAGTSAVVMNSTVYQVGKQTDGSSVVEGGYISESEFGLVSFTQGEASSTPVAAVDVRFSPEKIVITSASPDVGVCELDAQ
jgi:hypothetical protein